MQPWSSLCRLFSWLFSLAPFPRPLPLPASPPLPAPKDSPAPGIQLFVYDNRPVARLPSGKWAAERLLFRSADRHGLSYHVGSLVPESTRPFSMGDRERWLLRELPNTRAAQAFLVDGTDTLLLCNERELARKFQRLSGGSSDGLVASAEIGLWPEDIAWRGKHICPPRAYAPRSVRQGGCRTPHYPHPNGSSGGPLRFLNLGSVLGSPTAWLGMFRCMAERYRDWPDACPMGRSANGTFSYVSHRNFTTRRWGRKTGSWGWDQACYHMYVMEQAAGKLPAHCPPLHLDFDGAIALPLNKVSDSLQLGGNKRALFRPTGATPCILHSNGPSKYLVPLMRWWWERTNVSSRPNREEPAFREFFDQKGGDERKWLEANLKSFLERGILDLTSTPIAPAE